jgi:hypothetical protein
VSGHVVANGVVRRLLNVLQCFIVTEWGTGSESPAPGTDRETGNVDEAQVVSSLIKGSLPHTDDSDFFCTKNPGGNHHLLLDIDVPAALIESSTPGKHHLYVELNSGFGAHWEAYRKFLEAAAEIGLIEPGYCAVSIKRGHTDLRLPWVSKRDTAAARPVPRCVGCDKPAAEIDEYRDAALEVWYQEHPNDAADENSVTDADVNQYVYGNEGTVNPKSGQFACTSCYIKMGQPLLQDCAWLPEHARAVQQEVNDFHNNVVAQQHNRAVAAAQPVNPF